MAAVGDVKLEGKASLQVSLTRGSFEPGELVQGSVALRVAETVVCSEVVVTVVGKESAEWTEFVGGSTVPGSEKHKFLEIEIIVADQEQTYAPGEYTFPLQFQLPADAPSSFEIHGRSATPLETIVASSTYTVKAATSISGRFLEDVEAKESFYVYAPHKGHEVHGLESSITGKVGTLAVFSKGLCHIEGSLEKDVFAAGETLTVQTSITNQSPKDMHAISLRLYEEITVALPNRKTRTGSIVISRQDYLGVKAGQLVKQPLQLPLVISASQEPINATVTTGTYVNWRYRLVIKCKYSLSHSVRLEFPITIVSAPTAFDPAEPVAEPHVVHSL